MERELSIRSGSYVKPNARPSARQIAGQSESVAVRKVIGIRRVWLQRCSASQ
jgi:hypothetical protein